MVQINAHITELLQLIQQALEMAALLKLWELIIQLKVDEEKVLKWLQQGAQPTDTVKSLLSQLGIVKKFNESK